MNSAPRQFEPLTNIDGIRHLARTLHARVYRSKNGRLFLIAGKPDFHRLFRTLKRVARQATHEHWLTIKDLGLAKADIVELTPQSIASRRAALKTWSASLRKHPAHAPGNARAQRRIARDGREIACLYARLSELEGQLALNADSCREPLLLTGVEQHTLRTALGRPSPNRVRSPRTEWLARVVLWLTGNQALKRYLAGVEGVARAPESARLIAETRQLRLQLLIWKQRDAARSPVAWRQLLRDQIARLSTAAVAAANLSGFHRKQSFAENCDRLIKRCDQFLNPFDLDSEQLADAAAASLAACDNSGAPLPASFITLAATAASPKYVESVFQTLFASSPSPRYGLLLKTVDALNAYPSASDLKIIHYQVESGESIRNIVWAKSQGLLELFHSDRLGIRWLRRLHRTLAKLGLSIPIEDRYGFVESIVEHSDASVVDQFVNWLGRHSVAIRLPAMRERFEKALLELDGPISRLLGSSDEFAAWAKPLPTHGPLPDGFQPPMQPIADWLRTITHYQRLLERRETIPKSITKLFQHSSLDKQRSYLETLARDQSITPKQAARLNKLRSTATKGPSLAKLRRTAEEASLTIGFEALRQMMSIIAERHWRSITGSSIANRSYTRRIAFLKWTLVMNDRERELLTEIMHAHKRNEDSYREQFAVNRKWLREAADRGVDTQAWMVPPAEQRLIDGRQATIAVTNDPLEIFLMGSYFNTCLSLGQCNQMSVLTNAHDINKQVVYIRDHNHRLLGRTLVTVSSNYEFLGYTNYVAAECCEDNQRQQVVDALDIYCGSWARRSQLQLGNTGAPTNLGGGFWYDDEPTAWSEVAKTAWQTEPTQVAPPTLPTDATAASSPVVV